MEKYLGEIVINRKQIKEKVKELAEKISRDYKGKSILIIGILRGAIIFLADLVRELKIPLEIDFMVVSSYGSSTKTSGIVRILKDLDQDVKNRHLLLVEDIIDTGLTLNYLIRNLKARNPASLEVCALLSKEGKQRVPLEIKYLGFSIPNCFVVGYGLDFNEKFRNLPDIYFLKEEAISEG